MNKKTKKPKQDLSKRKVLWLSQKLYKDFNKVAERETGRGNSFNQHVRTIMEKEVVRSKKSG